MKYTKLYILLVGILFSFNLSAQVEDEVEFLYMKAKYLYDTDRHEDAVNAFNKVIKKDAGFQDALVLRGASKFGLAAYKGAMKDFNRSIEERGVTKDVVGWLALTHYKMDNIDIASNTLEAALLVDPKNRTLWNLQGDMAQDDGERLKACESWEKAASLGDTKAERKLAKNCGGKTAKKDRTSKNERTSMADGGKGKFNQGDPNNTDKGTSSDDDDTLDEDEVISLGDRDEDEAPKKDEADEDSSDDTPVRDEKVDDIDEDEVLSLGDKDEEDEEEAKPDRDPNEKAIIEIDEDLTLEIYGEGLGIRKILDQPNILILAEEDGVVAVNICVGRTGSVKSAEYNDDLSTIKKQSLISLAIRKAKEFWFAKDRKKEACGVILYKIKGS